MGVRGGREPPPGVMEMTSTFLPTPPFSDMLGRFSNDFRTFSGRTDLRIGVSRAKFDAESDFEVRLGVAPQKPGESSEKLIFRSKKSLFCFFGVVK